MWHVCPQHGAVVGPVPASWRLNLLRGSTAQWWEVGRAHNDAPTICPGLLSGQDVQLGRPSQGLTALQNPIHKTLRRMRRKRRGRKVRHAGEERGDNKGCGGGGNLSEGGEGGGRALTARQQIQQQRPGTLPRAGRSSLRWTVRPRKSLETDKRGKSKKGRRRKESRVNVIIQKKKQVYDAKSVVKFTNDFH